MTQVVSADVVFNKSDMLERLMGDEDLLLEVMHEFLNDVPHHIDALKEALERGDAPVVRREAHTLKGAASNVSAGALRQAAWETEKAGAAEELDRVASLVAEIDRQFEILKNTVANSVPGVSAG